MDRQIPSLLELIFRIKLSKIAKGRDLLSLLEMLLAVGNPPPTANLIKLSTLLFIFVINLMHMYIRKERQ